MVMKLLRLNFSFWLMILLTSISLSAYSASFYATVSKNKVVQNEVFQLRLVSDQPANAEAIDFSHLEEDFFTSRPSFASSVNIINNQRSQRSEWTLSLAANRLGILTIPSFELNGQHTDPISIQVSVDEQAPQMDELVQLHSTLSRDTLYPAESTILTTRLTIKADRRRLQNTHITPPSVDGMTIDQIGETQQYQTVIAGIEATIIEQQYRLTATQAGEYRLVEPRFQGSYLLGNTLHGGARIIPLKTEPNTYSLVVEPQPSDYQGAWLPTSQLALTDHWTNSQGTPITDSVYPLEVGEALTRDITLQVAGLSAEQLPSLALSYPDSISVYEQKPQFTTLDNGDTLMQLKQVLIPRRSGEIQLPDINIHWWNSRTKQAQLSQAKGLSLDVSATQPINAISPSEQNHTTAMSAQTIVVKEAGLWPYLAALLATFWLVTLGLYWRLYRKHTRLNEQETTNIQPSSAWQQLQNALTTQDAMMINHALSRWLNESPLTHAEREQVQQTLNTLHENKFSLKNQTCDYQALNTLIKRLQQEALKRSAKTQHPLAKL